jgi:hypothetical protein
MALKGIPLLMDRGDEAGMVPLEVFEIHHPSALHPEGLNPCKIDVSPTMRGTSDHIRGRQVRIVHPQFQGNLSSIAIPTDRWLIQPQRVNKGRDIIRQ